MKLDVAPHNACNTLKTDLHFAVSPNFTFTRSRSAKWVLLSAFLYTVKIGLQSLQHPDKATPVHWRAGVHGLAQASQAHCATYFTSG